MRRPLYILLIVAGVVVGAFGIYGIATRHGHLPPRFTAEAPSRFTVPLTHGTWALLVRARTGLYGTAATFKTLTVTAPGGANVTLAVPAHDATVTAGGVGYVEEDTLEATATGPYTVAVGVPTDVPVAGQNAPVAVLVTKPPHPAFPWDAVVVDGVVLILVGVGMTMLETRRRRELEVLEAAYAATDTRA